MDFEDNSLDKFLNNHFPDKYWNAETLFHYTTLDGLDKITAPAADLYCTNFHALNDNGEFRIGFKYAFDYLKQHNILPPDKLKDVNTATAISDSQYLLTPWIMSFSTEHDSLYQWGIYTPKANGGYAIGFDRNQFEKSIANMGSQPTPKYLKHSISLLPCIYLPKETEYADQLLYFMFGEYRRKVFKHEPSDDLHELSQILRLILLFASIVKHDSFEPEKEFRLIIQATDPSALANCVFFGGKPRLPSMINREINPISKAIKKIIISPHGDIGLLHTTASIMKISRGINCEITISKSSYNGR